MVSCHVPRCSSKVGFFCCLGFLLPTPSAFLAAKKRISENRAEGKRSEHQRTVPGRPWPHIYFMKGKKMLLCKGCSCERHWVCSVQLQWSRLFSLQLVLAALNLHFSSPLSLFPFATGPSGPEELKFCHFSSDGSWILSQLRVVLTSSGHRLELQRMDISASLAGLAPFPQGSW